MNNIRTPSHFLKWLPLILALLLSACMEKDPYEKFAGTWVFNTTHVSLGDSSREPRLVALSIDPARKLLTVKILCPESRNKGWGVAELPILDMEMREGSLALKLAKPSLPEPVREALQDYVLNLGSLVLEPLDAQAMLARCYRNAIAPKDLLDGNASKASFIEELRRPDGAQAKALRQIPFSSAFLNGNWFVEDAWEKPAMTINLAEGKIRLRDTSLIKSLGDTSVSFAGYLEFGSDKGRGPGFLNLSRPKEDDYDRRRDRESITLHFLKTPPPEAVAVVALGDRGMPIQMFPEMSSSQRQQYVKAREEARRQAAKKELEEQRKREAEARKAEEERRLAEEKAKAEAEARQKALEQRRAAMPEFSFGDIRLSDSPQQMVKKGLERYSVATSFPVQQKGNSIATIRNPQIGYLPFLLADPALSEALGGLERTRMTVGSRYWQLGSESTQGYFLGPDKAALKAGVRPDLVIFEDKTRDDPRSTRMSIAFYTLPDSQPQALYLNVDGDIVLDALSVFKERYGDPENVIQESGGDVAQYLWRSDKEVAVMRTSSPNARVYHHYELYIISLPAYAELQKFTQNLKAEEERKQREAEEAERARQKAVEEARKAGI